MDLQFQGWYALLLLPYSFSDIEVSYFLFVGSAENTSRAVVSIGQSDLLGNKRRKFLLNSHISKSASKSIDFHWSPFPTEISGVSAIIPSPSGEKLLLVRNSEDDSPTKLEIWGSCQLKNEIHIAKSVHGSLYTDEWLVPQSFFFQNKRGREVCISLLYHCSFGLC